MKHSMRAAIVWWLGCLAVVGCAGAALTGYQVELADGLPLSHLAISTLSSWLVMLVISWFGLYRWLGWGLQAVRVDVAVAMVVLALALATAVLGFLAWEDGERFTALHRTAAWSSLVAQVAALAWYGSQRSSWFQHLDQRPRGESSPRA